MTRNFGFAQDLCNALPPGAVKGAFEIVGNLTSGCTPLNVKVKDLSGAEEVHYLFDYRNEESADLNWNAGLDTTEGLFALGNEPVLYTILQYGKKGGKEMFFCKTIVVRPNNKPVFSYNTCNNSNLEINIPNHPSNDFDYYEINWGNGPIETVQSNNIPFSKNKTTSFPTNINVKGLYKNTTLNCSSPPSINIPFKNPANFPGGYDDPYKTNIDQIKLLTKSTAEIKFHGAMNSSGYSLNMREQTNTNYNEIKTNIQPGNILITLPDSNKSYCFTFSRITNCGLEDSPEICTLPLHNVEITENSYNLKWSIYPSSITQSDNNLFGRYLIKNPIIRKKEGSIISIINGLNPYQIDFTDMTFDCEKKVCYTIEMQTSGQYYYYKFGGKSISNTICIDRKNFHPPAITDLDISLEYDNKFIINYQNNSGWNLPVKKYSLMDELGIEIAFSNTQNRFEITPKNPSVQSECFQVGFTDQCKSTSMLSPKVCSMVLETSSDEILIWDNNITPFGNSQIDHFQLVNFDEINNNEIGSQQLDKTIKDFKPDLNNYEIEAKFKLKAISTSGKESFSNFVSIPIEAFFYIPEAISMDGNNVNDLLEIKGRFGRVKQTNFEIYNRWGSIIYTGTGNEWKPEEKIPTGTYFYKILFIMTDNTYKSISGNLEILK